MPLLRRPLERPGGFYGKKFRTFFFGLALIQVQHPERELRAEGESEGRGRGAGIEEEKEEEGGGGNREMVREPMEGTYGFCGESPQ